MTIEERITRLEDIEAIRYLQAKYQRCLDTRDFDGLAECFIDEAVSSYDDEKLSYNGKDEIIKFLCSVMSLKMPSTHLIHGGEIDILSSNTAKAKWYLEDQLYHDKYLAQIHGAAIYHVEYVKIDGNWLISSIGYNRCYEAFQFRTPMNLLTLHKRTYLKKKKKEELDKMGLYNRYFYETQIKKVKK